MFVGKFISGNFISEQLRLFQRHCGGFELEVRVTRHPWEKDLRRRAEWVFRDTPQIGEAGILILANLTLRRAAVVCGEQAFASLGGQPGLERMLFEMREDFLSTHPETALALGVERLRTRLQN